MDIRRKLVFLIVSVSIVLGACAPTRPVTDEPTAAPVSFLSTEMPTQALTLETASAADLKNGMYLIDGQTITLVNGMAETELAPGSASKQVTRFFGNAIPIDLNADGRMDSGFLLQQENGGSGTFYYVVAALQTTDGYLGTNAIFIGDRIAPQSTNVDPNNPAQFIVNYADRNADEPMTALPTVGVSKIFKVENGALVEVVTSSPI